MAQDYVWQWQEDESLWHDYDSATSLDIETAFRTQQSDLQLTHGFFRQNKGYHINMDFLVQQNAQSGTVRPIRRIPPPQIEIVAVEPPLRLEEFTTQVPSAHHDGKDCPLCLQNLADDPDAQGHDVAVLLSQCFHVFHGRCLQGIIHSTTVACPVCRTEYKRR